MSTITKELAKLFRKITNSEIDAEGNAHVVLSPADSLLINNARIALASLEAHSADDVSDAELNAALLLHRLKVEGHSQLSDAFRAGFKYARRTAPPAPASVPDERYQHLSELYHAQEKRLFKLAQRINGPSFDKYAYSPSQAIDVLESAIFGERKDEDCRAAMLQAGNSPVIPDGWKLVPIDPTKDMLRAGQSVVGFWLNTVHCYSKMLAAAPAAPQQEVKAALEHGMQRYAGAMQKLSEGDN